MAPARDPQPRAIPQNSVPRTSGIGRGDREPHIRPRHVRAPRRFRPPGRGLHHREAPQGPTPDVGGLIAATPPLARCCTGEGRRTEFSPILGFGEISDRGLARLPQSLLTEPLSPTPRKYPAACRFLETNSLATVARPWCTSLPPGRAARFRWGGLGRARPRRLAGVQGGGFPGPCAQCAHRSQVPSHSRQLEVFGVVIGNKPSRTFCSLQFTKSSLR